jgi:hypothetical protein
MDHAGSIHQQFDSFSQNLKRITDIPSARCMQQTRLQQFEGKIKKSIV